MSKKFSETVTFKKIDNNTVEIHTEKKEGIGILLFILMMNMTFLDDKFPNGNVNDIMDFLG